MSVACTVLGQSSVGGTVCGIHNVAPSPDTGSWPRTLWYRETESSVKRQGTKFMSASRFPPDSGAALGIGGGCGQDPQADNQSKPRPEVHRRRRPAPPRGNAQGGKKSSKGTTSPRHCRTIQTPCRGPGHSHRLSPAPLPRPPWERGVCHPTLTERRPAARGNPKERSPPSLAKRALPDEPRSALWAVSAQLCDGWAAEGRPEPAFRPGSLVREEGHKDRWQPPAVRGVIKRCGIAEITEHGRRHR